MNPVNYRQVHGVKSFLVAIPPKFAKEVGIQHGTNVRIEVVEGKIVIVNADAAQSAATPKGERK